jgi:hypothetical protein
MNNIGAWQGLIEAAARAALALIANRPQTICGHGSLTVGPRWHGL